MIFLLSVTFKLFKEVSKMHIWSGVCVPEGIVSSVSSINLISVHMKRLIQAQEASFFIVYAPAHSFGTHWRVCGLQMKQHGLIIDGPK